VVEADQILSGIGLIWNAGARFEAPETTSAQRRFEDVHRGGYDPEQHLKDMVLDGVSGEVLYPSQGFFYFKVADATLMSAIFCAYNDWLADFCCAGSARLKGIAMINLDDVPDAMSELERAARLAFEDRRYDQSEYEPFWAAASALDLPLSLTRPRDDRARSAASAT
jgi:predicted TIM-barrel fold metal-dependent hydrolase